MPSKTVNTDLDVKGKVTATGFQDPAGGSATEFWRTDGTKGAAAASTDLSKVVKVDAPQTFILAEKVQGRANIDAEKLSDVVVINANPTLQQFIDNEKNTILVTTGTRNFVLPTAGALPNKHQFMVKTGTGGAVNFSVADATVTIEYNSVGAVGYMGQRSEAWVLLMNNIYYVNGEVV